MKESDSKKVLIVEDDMLLSLVEERLIKKMGHEVVAKVVSGEEAITKAKEMEPDLILMDIILKGEMDGIEAMEEIRKVSDVPVVYLSGNSDRFNYERAKKTGFTDYLVKPITNNDLKKPFLKAFEEEVKGSNNYYSENGQVQFNQTA
jgi:CheY-like chemotaxis protein